MSLLTIDVDTTCSNCNKTLKGNQIRSQSILINPCEECMKAEYERGFNKAIEIMSKFPLNTSFRNWGKKFKSYIDWEKLRGEI